MCKAIYPLFFEGGHNKKEHKKDQAKLKFSGGKAGTKPPAKQFQLDYSNSTASETNSGNISVLMKTTMGDFSNIQVQLEAMTNTQGDLWGDLKSMLKQDETEDFFFPFSFPLVLHVFFCAIYICYIHVYSCYTCMFVCLYVCVSVTFKKR